MMSGKTATSISLLLLLCYILVIQEHFLNVFFKLMDTNTSAFHDRQKRQTSENIIYEIQVGINVTDLNRVRELLNSQEFNIPLTEIGEILNIEITTECSSVPELGYQCRCEENFAWPLDRCEVDGCSGSDEDGCRCLTVIPRDGQYCQRVTEPAPTAPENIIYEIQVGINVTDLNRVRELLNSLEFNIPLTEIGEILNIEITTECSSVPESGYQCRCEENFAWPLDRCEVNGCSGSDEDGCRCLTVIPRDGQYCQRVTEPAPTAPENIIYEIQVGINVTDLNRVRELLNSLEFNIPLTENGEILDIEITTECSSVPELGYQCRCEENFAWPLDRCEVDGCSGSDEDGCRCLTVIPRDGQYCQRVTEPAPTDFVNFDLVVDVRIAASSMRQQIINKIRTALENTEVPLSIAPSVNLMGINLTTVCDGQSDGLQCKCEPEFAWPFDKCEPSSCSNITCNTCSCINELPDDGTFCEPYKDITQCPTTATTTSTPTSSTPASSTSSTPENSTSSMPANSTSSTPASSITSSTPASSTSPTPENSISSMKANSTSSMPANSTSSTPASSITSSTPASLTTGSTATINPVTETVEITLEREFDETFNNENSETINRIIQSEAQIHITDVIDVSSPDFRRGSTIIFFSITAPVIRDDELQALRTGLFNQLSELYPVVFDSPRELRIAPPDDVFFTSDVTLTCGPPSEELNFGTIDSVVWTRDGRILENISNIDSSSVDGQQVLIVSNILPTDEGEYECLMRNDNGSFFREKKAIQVLDRPVIHVLPVRQTVSCDRSTVELSCFVEGNHTVFFQDLESTDGQNITREVEIPEDCPTGDQTFTCALHPHEQFSQIITLRFTRLAIVCDDEEFGTAALNDTVAVTCSNGSVGEITAVCRENGQFEDIQDNCVLAPIQRLLDWSEGLMNLTLPEFLEELSNVTVDLQFEVAESPATIIAIVKILNNVAIVARTTALNETLMEDVIITAGVLTIDEARESWRSLNDVTINSTETNFPGRSSFGRRMSKTKSFMQRLFSTRMSEILSVSSLLLQSLETITTRVVNETVDIGTPRILFNKSEERGSFNIETNLTEIDIPEANGFITVITFISMDNVLPARDEANSSSKFINGRVVLVQSTDTVNNISFAYDRLNRSLQNPECVFWNFSLFDGLGGWDDEGCEFVLRENNTFTCTCDHLTSFSILMSIGVPDDASLVYITYIGLGISLASLIICLIIEAVVWRKISSNRTSYLRHVGIVNIAVSLLIADIWLIVALNVSEQSNIPVCIAATFFVHLFYLALFFWMLASALLLLYRTVYVLGGDMSKSSMLASGFCLGYGAPIIIATITIAVTAPEDEYIRRTGGCWLNFDESRALLAFVIPALLIVLINLIILIIVIYKILRSRTAGLSAAQPNDKHVIWVIIRSLAILTPLFGLTWALGVGTLVDPNNIGIHIAFSFFNSLQGFFVLVFGTLLDKKVRSEMVSISTSATGTRTTSGGISSGLFGRLRRNRDGYHTSSSSPLNSSNT